MAEDMFEAQSGGLTKYATPMRLTTLPTIADTRCSTIGGGRVQVAGPPVGKRH